MYINTERAELKSGTGFFSEVQGQLFYGNQVTIIEEKGKWALVKATNNSKIAGWLPLTSLTKKKILNNALYSIKASTEELALAGKGFSAENEASFSNGATKRALKKLDILESIYLPLETLQDFILDANLSAGE